MSTSENEALRPAKRHTLVYTGAAAFCLIVFLVYDRFSHGVRSPYMTLLFLWPLVLGAIPCLLFWKIPKLRRPGILALNLYHSGVAALAVSSLLRGIFEIAGNASVCQEWLMTAGWVMVLLGGAVYMCGM